MCPILQADNECKMQMLPLAASSQLVFDAVAAATFHRLAYHDDPSFNAKADRHKSSAIKTLSASCWDVFSPGGSPDDRLFSAAALVILMYDEMIAAQDYFTTLAQIIASMRGFMDLSSLECSAKLQTYLQDQFSMYVHNLPQSQPHPPLI